MQDRAVGEQLAKAGIYLIFSLSLFAFLMFVHAARQFDMAGAAVESAALAEDAAQQSASVPQDPQPATGLAPKEVPATAAVETEPDSALAEPAVEPDEAALEPDAAGGQPAEDTAEPRAEDAAITEEFKHQSETEVLPEPEVSAIVPNMYGKEADLAALQAELGRMTAMGFSFSGDLSANYVGEFYATSYCAEAYPHICGGNGVTASGTVPTPGLTVASDWSVLPPGTWIYISGVGIRRVEDSGGAIKGARLDVVLATHSEALSWSGQGNHDVWILS